MHPLAARLMSRIGMGAAGRPPAHSTPMVKAGIGLDPSNPLLPPVHNLRMIYLKEPLTPAEKKLHAARVALRELKKTNNPPNRTKLYTAMAELQGSESDYSRDVTLEGRIRPCYTGGTMKESRNISRRKLIFCLLKPKHTLLLRTLIYCTRPPKMRQMRQKQHVPCWRT